MNVIHHFLNQKDCANDLYEWESISDKPFNEAFISFNGTRPTQGYFLLSVSTYTNKWSNWLPYMEWGSTSQKSFKSSEDELSIFQDTITSKKDAFGIRIRLKAHEGALIESIKSVHLSINNTEQESPTKQVKESHSLLNVKGLSQMALIDPRNKRLCSPTSITAFLNHLNINVNPIEFAENCLDTQFDIFGNWVLNMAEASSYLYKQGFSCWVQRYQGFECIQKQLNKGIPSIISIKGPLKGAALPYENGHLCMVIGFNTKDNEVICMDPAFESDCKTHVAYNMNDLYTAWKKQGFIAYTFQKTLEIV